MSSSHLMNLYQWRLSLWAEVQKNAREVSSCVAPLQKGLAGWLVISIRIVFRTMMMIRSFEHFCPISIFLPIGATCPALSSYMTQHYPSCSKHSFQLSQLRATMEEDMNLVHAYLSLSDSFTSTLSAVVASINTCNEIFSFLEEDEEESDVLVADLLESLQSFNSILTLLLHQGTQLPPPGKKSLFPDFVASNFPGRDLHTELITRPWLFYHMTGETPHSLQAVVQDLGQ